MKKEEVETVQAYTAVRKGQSYYSTIVQIYERENGKFLLVDNTSPLLAWFFPQLKDKRYYNAYEVSRAFVSKNFYIWNRAWDNKEYKMMKQENNRQHANIRFNILAFSAIYTAILYAITDMINNIVHITKINTVSEVKLVSLLIFFMIFTLVLMNLGKRYYLQLFFIDKFKLSKSKVKIKGAIFNRKYKGIYVKYIITFFAICLFLFMLVFGNPQVSGMPQGALIFGICSGIFGSFPDMYGPGYFLTRNKENKIQLPSIEVKIVKE